MRTTTGDSATTLVTHVRLFLKGIGHILKNTANTIYIQTINTLTTDQFSRKTDGHQIVNKMDNSLRNRLRAIHLNEWIPIRDQPDEEPPDRSPLQRPHTSSIRPIPARAVPSETMDDDVARQITIDYGVTRRTLLLGSPPPRDASEATGLSDEEDETKHLSRVMSGAIHRATSTS